MVWRFNPFTNKLDQTKSDAELDAAYVKKPSDTMGGTLTFSEIYAPSPASLNEPAIRANRNIIIKSGHKIILDGA
jgi:hypothetical protein